MRLSALLRSAAVTALIAALGALLGGVLGLGLALLILVVSDFSAPFMSAGELFSRGSVFGVIMAVPAAVLWSWTLLRRVPLWRAVGEPTAVGTLLAFVAGIVIPGLDYLACGGVSLAGSLLAALRLRRTTARIGASELAS